MDRRIDDVRPVQGLEWEQGEDAGRHAERRAVPAVPTREQIIEASGNVLLRGLMRGLMPGTIEYDVALVSELANCRLAATPALPAEEVQGLTVERLLHERDALAQAIRDAAVNAGMCGKDHDLTGPQLIMFCGDMANYIIHMEANLAASGAVPAPELPEGNQQPQADSGVVVPPFAAPAGQHDADDVALCRNINALLALDAAGALVPHGIGGHARALLTAAVTRLAGSACQGGNTSEKSSFAPSLAASTEPVAWMAANGSVITAENYADTSANMRKTYSTPIFTHPATQAAQQTEADFDQALKQRDHYHDMADKLAEAIAKHLGVNIGEHSSANCPWSEALLAIDAAEAPPAQPDKQFTERQIAAAARALADRNAKECGVDKDDNWQIYGNDFIELARAAIDAAILANQGEKG